MHKLLLFLLLAGCAQSLSIQYHYSTETSLVDIDVNDSRITFTSVDEEKIREKCALWIQQSPCWDQTDVVTEERWLSAEELYELRRLSVNARKLQSSVSARCYPHSLVINGKEITQCSPPDGPAQPEEFAQLVAQLGIYTSK